MRRYSFPLSVVSILLVGLTAGGAVAWAQFDPLGENPPEGFGGFSPSGFGAQKPTVSVTAQFTVPDAGKPGRLFIEATMEPGWHIYSLTQPSGGPTTTRIKLEASDGYEPPGGFQSSPPPEKKQDALFDMVVETHHGRVVWYAPLTLTQGIDPAVLEIKGSVHALPCTETSCTQPQDFEFVAKLGPGIEVPEGEPAATDTGQSVAQAVEPVDYRRLAVHLGLAFLGGLILNLMPCVLPVISLKVLSFLEQAGESRARVFTLNLWYVLGLMSVFIVLAALAATAGLAWGEQFTLPWFKVAMTGLVFVMALSFLGVWEIPIPGFVGTGRAGEFQAKEGASGAFFKGVFATILATPCSGPFLGPVFGYLLKQPPHVAYWVFGAVGLGMGSPYLVIGTFPKLIRFLPKPGSWMETLKEVMAFLLLGTVVYLFTTLSAMYFVPTLTLLVGLWFACWLIGRTPMTAGPRGRAAAWLGGIVSAILVGVFAFTVLLYESKMPWRPFSPEALAQARADGKTVMVDFTADWCPTCKMNLKLAIDTQDVRDLVEKNRVVPLLADWTDQSPMVKKALNDLGYNSIPLLVTWPAGRSDDVIVLADLLSERQVLDALKKAGPSKPETPKGTAGPNSP